jgi:protein-L-isoaspartate(D-aspartate) O-methyltransferase
MRSATSDTLDTDRGAAARQAMVDNQIRTNDMVDPALVAALLATPREPFLPAALHDAAYIDRALPLGVGRALNPVLTSARLIDDARIAPGRRVLLIGAATGYTAALLARLGAQVVAVEQDGALVAIARAALTGSPSVTLVEAGLTAGAPDHAPYDALIVDGAIESLPTTLLVQLKDGARIADNGVTRLARAVKVGGADSVGLFAFADLECVALPGFAAAPGFTF